METGEVVLILKGHHGQIILKFCVRDVSVFSGEKDNTEINHDRILLQWRLETMEQLKFGI